MFLQAASAVASATMTPLNVEAPPNRLLDLVAKVLSYFTSAFMDKFLLNTFRLHLCKLKLNSYTF